MLVACRFSFHIFGAIPINVESEIFCDNGKFTGNYTANTLRLTIYFLCS